MKPLKSWLDFLSGISPDHMELGLERVSTVLDRLGLRKCWQIPVVEVAGTNGKGTVCALMAAALERSGIRCALYTSPHLLAFNERIVCGGRMIEDGELTEAFARVHEACGSDIRLTYFEYATAAALYFFKKARPEVLVLEVGLGGRLDAVNALDADIALITSIGFDHMAILGSTLSEIAAEKAGIIKPHSQVVCGLLGPEACAVIERRCAQLGVVLQLEGRDFSGGIASGECWYREQGGEGVLKLPLPASPACCVPAALKALGLLRQRGLAVSAQAVRAAVAETVLPGRMELVHRRPMVFLDVAHNVPASAHLARVLAGRACPGRRLCVCGMLRDKDIEGVMGQLVSVFARFYVCTLHTGRGAPGERLKQALLASGAPAAAVQVLDTPEVALEVALADAASGDELTVCGSFVTVAAASIWFRDKFGN